MSTPRRPEPISSGAPMIAMWEWRMVVIGGWPLEAGSSSSRLGPVEHPRIGDGFADVFQSAHPGHEAFDTHAEAGVRHTAVFAQIDVPVESFRRKFVLFQALHEQIQIVDALTSAYDLAIAFGRDHIHAQGQLRTIGIG